MKTTSRNPSSQDPQRRNRGTRMRTAPSVSPMPTANAPGKAKAEGIRSSTRNCDQKKGSVSFHAPDTKNKIARNKAQIPPMAFFQAGKSTLTRSRPIWAGFAVVSDIYSPFYPIRQGPSPPPPAQSTGWRLQRFYRYPARCAPPRRIQPRIVLGPDRFPHRAASGRNGESDPYPTAWPNPNPSLDLV